MKSNPTDAAPPFNLGNMRRKEPFARCDTR
jgi:hypothetical protein